MQRIYKYVLDSSQIGTTQFIQMPYVSKLLSVNFQDDGQLVCWAQVDENSQEMCNYRFYIAFTGAELPEMIRAEWWTHIATLQHQGFVFHIYYQPDR